MWGDGALGRGEERAVPRIEHISYVLRPRLQPCGAQARGVVSQDVG